MLIEGLDKILAYNDISLNLYFKTLQPLEFTDVEDKGLDDETKEEETGVDTKMNFSKESPNIETIAGDLITLGEDEETLEGWKLVDEMDVDYDMEDKLDKMIGLASTGVARPNSKSKGDKDVDGTKFKVRYQYSPLKTSDNSREFCKKMVTAKKLYRKEDIIKMDKMPVNAGWGVGGADTYSIWKFKGGGSCHHRWVRKTFEFTGVGKGDVLSPRAKTIPEGTPAPKGVRTKNPKEVSMMPKDMKNEGFIKPRKK